MKRTAHYIVFYGVLLALWALLAKLKIWPPYLFPTPWGVADELYSGEIVHFALVPIGGAPNPADRRDLRQLAGNVVLPARQDHLEHERHAVRHARHN